MIKKPVVPEHVCPYVDMALELITDMVEQEDREWRKHQAILATALLEHVRISAEKLRIGGKFWYDKSKRERRKTINKKKSQEPGLV
jgi:hypothetical protein